MADAAGRTVGSYRLVRRLGAGGMGEVYLAHDSRLDRPVAIKHARTDLSSDQLTRFRREAWTVARLSHPAIVTIFDLVTDDDGDWIVMEYVDGVTLREHLRRHGRPSIDQALAWVVQVVDALESAHEKGIVHRDLKAENVMLTRGDQIKVLDFGIAKPLSDDAPGDGLTETGAVLGTLRSIAPEQAQGQPVDHRADLFSLGVLLYELLTGLAPFKHENPLRGVLKLIAEPHRPVVEREPSIPSDLSALVDELLAKEPRNRPANAAVVKRALWASLPSTVPLVRREPDASPPVMPDLADVSESTSSLQLAERRQVSVVCCELVSSDGTALDPEWLHESLPVLDERLTEVVTRFGGQMGSRLGHRLTAVFGYPIARGDDAVRAVRAALELRTRKTDTTDVRIGIHTGQAVVTAGAASGGLVLGVTADRALAVQGHANLGAVVLSAATRRLVDRAFELEPLGEVWRVESIRRPEIRGADARGLVPMVARDRELELLLGSWQRAREGRGQVVLISGDAGIGKTRLLRGLHDALPTPHPTWWMVHGSPFLQSSPFAPLADLLRREALDPTAEDPVGSLSAFLGDFGLAGGGSTYLLASLLELPADEHEVVASLGPDERRKLTLDLLTALFLERAEQTPLLLVVEDLHWIDPSTLEVLDRVIGQISASSLCMLVTSRPDGLPSWRHEVDHTRIHLGPLTASESASLIDRVVADRTLSVAVRYQILARTDGVPLFLEELTKTLLESEQTIEPNAIPETLRDSLAARLDRLGTAKRVAQIAAVLGRSFKLDLLAQVVGANEDSVARSLERLVDAGLLYRKGFGASTRYVFKHALIQDIAYESHLRKDRQALHRTVADMLVDRFPTLRDRQPEFVAHHFTEAGDVGTAVHFLRLAGQKAIRESAFREARDHFGRACDLIDTSGDLRVEVPDQIAGLTGHARARTPVNGFTSEEVEATWSRIGTLSGDRLATPNADALLGLYIFHTLRANLSEARAVGDQIHDAFHDSDDPLHFFLSRIVHSSSCLFGGDLRGALQSNFEMLELSNPALRQAQLKAFGVDYEP
ncbi:MAG: protein kinase, partial [Acidobacteriota bacterium]